MTKLSRIDFILDRLERGESPEEVAEAEAVELDQVRAVEELREADEDLREQDEDDDL